MPCTTLLVGKKASNDGSTMIARTDDGSFDVKKLVLIDPKKQPKNYKSVIGHLTIPLPEEPLRYTSCPNVDPAEGVWPATGINAANVGMSATETITTNPIVADTTYMADYAITVPSVDGLNTYTSLLHNNIVQLELGQITPEEATADMKIQLELNLDDITFE